MQIFFGENNQVLRETDRGRFFRETMLMKGMTWSIAYTRMMVLSCKWPDIAVIQCGEYRCGGVAAVADNG